CLGNREHNDDGGEGDQRRRYHPQNSATPLAPCLDIGLELPQLAKQCFCLDIGLELPQLVKQCFADVFAHFASDTWRETGAVAPTIFVPVTEAPLSPSGLPIPLDGTLL